MNFDPKTVSLWAALFASVGIYCILLPPQRSPLPPAVDPPWIGLPKSGMDASQSPLRELLAMRAHGMSRFAASCGTQNDTERARYRLWISRNAREDFREIEFVPDGEWLDVTVREGMPPPSPESSHGGDSASADDVVQPVVRVRLHRHDVEPIRRAWETQALWHAEQQPLGCMDGTPVTLEACIDGRYAIRHRNCDIDAYSPARAMWDAVDRLLPAPTPAYRHTR